MNRYVNVMFALVLVSVGLCNAQSIRVPFTFRNAVPSGVQTRIQTVGFDTNATVGVDRGLDEIEIPTLPFPGSVFYVWTVPPTQELVWLSPLDIRPLRSEPSWLDTFNVTVAWNGGTLEVQWPNEKPIGIDSAYIVDAFSTFPNSILKAKLWTTDVFSTSNPAIDKFRILVWITPTVNSVDENTKVHYHANVYPVPVVEELTLQSIADAFSILDAQGKQIQHGTFNNGFAHCNLQSVPNGVYILKLSGPNGVSHKPIIVAR